MVDKSGFSYFSPLVSLGRKVLNACFEQIANVIIGDLYYIKTGGKGPLKIFSIICDTVLYVDGGPDGSMCQLCGPFFTLRDALCY